MSDDDEDLRTPEERALGAAKEAARQAAAYVLYEEQCLDMDVDPKPSLGELSDRARKRWLSKADALLAGPRGHEAGGVAAGAPAAPAAPAPRAEGEPDPVSAVAGSTARVEERPPDEYGVNEQGEWDPPVAHVLLKVVRGNLATAFKVPTDILAPDITGSAGMVIDQAKAAMLAQQSQGGASAPLSQQTDVALRFMKDGTTVNVATRLRLSDFTEQLEEDPSLPGLLCELVDVQGQAMTQATGTRAAAPGNPVVIGSGDQRGQVLGRPVAGGQGAAHPQPGMPSQGAARV